MTKMTKMVGNRERVEYLNFRTIAEINVFKMRSENQDNFQKAKKSKNV